LNGHTQLLIYAHRVNVLTGNMVRNTGAVFVASMEVA